jgi:hypothetical protein
MQLSELFEAKVSNANVGAAMSRIISYLEKKMGFKLRKLGVEEFKNSSSVGTGIRYVEDGTVNCIRFNWTGSKSSEIDSVDLWNGSGHDPQYHITFKGTSLVKSLPTLVDVLKHPKLGKIKVHGDGTADQHDKEEALAEARKKCGSHPKFPDATYDDELSDKNVACFTDSDGEQRYVKRKDLPDDHPNKAAQLDEAKKGEFTPEAAIADMITKLEAGRTMNRSEFVMHYHPENAHAYDDWVEEHKDELVIQGKRISLPKGQKFGAAPKAGGSMVGGGGSGELLVQRGGKGEQYEVEVPEDRVSFGESLEHLEGLTTGLVKGSFNALFVAGRGGTGKTQTVEDTLEEHGLSDGSGYFKITGSASPIGIYTALYKNRTGIVMFDDCDGALESQDGRNIIKAATDTKKVRKIAWSKKSSGMYDPDDESRKQKEPAEGEDGDDDVDIDGDQIPKHFQFTGRVIFISNLPLNKLDPDGALRTRAFIITIDPTPEEIFERMGEIVNDIKIEGGSLSAKERQAVLSVVKTSKNAKSASLRTLVRALGLAASGAPNWEKLVQLYA